jgi:hypothetical protein
MLAWFTLVLLSLTSTRIKVSRVRICHAQTISVSLKNIWVAVGRRRYDPDMTMAALH